LDARAGGDDRGNCRQIVVGGLGEVEDLLAVGTVGDKRG
jgi:hypothetical protein